VSYKNVVVGTDGSETAEKAVRHAGRLAATFGARLVVVTAFAPVHHHESGHEEVPPDDIRWMLADRNQAEEKARTGRELAKSEGAPDVVVQTADGEAAEVLLEAAGDFAADLIVVGSKGLTGASRFILGSVASSVSHHAPCDVLVVHTTG
jgi:nucleotide-binding universal stress UspA family protein